MPNITAIVSRSVRRVSFQDIHYNATVLRQSSFLVPTVYGL
jgi:hypothetical protein